MLATALTLDGPAAMRYPRGLAAPLAPLAEIEPLGWGAAAVLQEGADVALIGIGTGVGIAREAAATAGRRGPHADAWWTPASSSRWTRSCCSGWRPRTGA